jgi:hypothetical protein
MAEQHDSGDWESSSRGEAAWKETMDRVALRNSEARKVGKQQRDTYERERDEARRAAAARRHAEFLNRSGH